MTQQNAALVEESAAAASALHEQAQRLAQVVSVFNVGGYTAPAPTAQARRSVPAPMAPRQVQRTAPKQIARPTVKPKLAAPAPKAIAAPKRAPAPVAKSAKAGADDEWESF